MGPNSVTLLLYLRRPSKYVINSQIYFARYSNPNSSNNKSNFAGFFYNKLDNFDNYSNGLQQQLTINNQVNHIPVSAMTNNNVSPAPCINALNTVYPTSK